jgi:hypothetical protein
MASCHFATDPTPLCYSAPPEGTHQSALYLVRGSAVCGTGGTSVTSIAVPEATFVATIRFVVNRAKPNTTYFIQRAAEAFRSSTTDADGVCQRADGLPPWSASDPPAPAFVTFPIPWKPGPKIALTTDAEGSGSIEFEHQAASIPRGSSFDVQMRLVDSEDAPTSELRSGCMTVLVR